MATTRSTREVTVDTGHADTLRDMLEASAHRFGARPALRGWLGGERRSVSFAELARHVDRFAASLRGLGLRPGDRVALIGENSPEWAIAWFGIALAGGIGVPISANWGSHEVTGLVSQSGARFAVASVGQVPKIEVPALERIIVLGPTRKGADSSDRAVGELGSRGIAFQSLALPSAAVEDVDSAVPLDPDDVATMTFTSGTSGAPKGVMLTHANLLADAAATARAISASPRDRLLLVLPLHHTFPLAVGLTTSVLSGVEVVFESDLRRIQERMADARPTIFMGVPALYDSMYRTIVARLETDGRLASFRRAEALVKAIKRRTGLNVGRIAFRELHEKLGGRIRFLATGGAAASPELIRGYLNLGFLLAQGWGLTEAVSVVTAQSPSQHRFLFTKYFERHAGSVGRPVLGVELRLADVPDKQIYVGKHGEGEVLVRGPMVMKGYFQNEEATRSTFEDGWLRSGDIGRIDRDGNVTITGRVKSVIVLPSGEKVYPDEVEEVFAASPLVRDVCVLSRQSPQEQTLVSAVICPDPTTLRERAQATGQSLTPELARGWVEAEVDRLQAGLSPFKRIGQVILTDTPLPRTELHKVRRGLITGEARFDLERLLAGSDVT